MYVEAAMTRRTLTVALALGMVAGLARADQAKPRGGSGGGGGGSSSAGVHHSSSGGSSSHASGGNGGGRSSSYSQAEQRHPRAGTGGGAYRPYRYYPGYGYWYGPGYSPGYYYGYWPYYGAGAYWGVGGYYGGGYYGGGYGGGYYGGGYYGGGSPDYRSYGYSDASALRLLVEPDDARVYVDGYYAGEVDDFDGMFQRLNVAPGRHEITLKKDGYRTHRFKVYAAANSTLKLRYTMEKGSGPDTMEDLAGERGLYEEQHREARRDERDTYDRDAEREDRPENRLREDAPVDEPRHEAEPPAGLVPDGNAAPGLLTLNVSPADASVYVDGRFVGAARQTGELELRPGRHRVEVVRPGFRTAERDVMVETGRTQALSLDLARP